LNLEYVAEVILHFGSFNEERHQSGATVLFERVGSVRIDRKTHLRNEETRRGMYLIGSE
jgi:hypothetical protein